MGGRRAHGLELPDPVAEVLERADAGHVGARPNGPDGDLRLPQAGEIEDEGVFGRRIGQHAGHVQGQQRPGGLAGQIILANLEHGRSIRSWVGRGPC
jgi:hypothetical protein